MELIDLHTHLGGSVSPATLWSIAHTQGIKLPVKDYWEFVKLTKASPDRVSSLDEYVAVMHLMERIQSSPAAVERSVYETIGKGYRACNVTQTEIRFNPAKRNMNSELDLDHIILAALHGMDRAVLEYGVKAGLIFCLAREFDPKVNSIIVDKAIKYKNRGVVGIDLAGPEKNTIELSANSISIYQGLLERARAAGLGLTIHTGETSSTGSDGIKSVIRNFNPNRIGHGIKAAYDKETMEMLVEKEILLELCPTSNINTKAVCGIQELDFIIRTFIDNKVIFNINTDGPYLLETNLDNEINLLRTNETLSDSEIAQTLSWARQYSFIR